MRLNNYTIKLMILWKIICLLVQTYLVWVLNFACFTRWLNFLEIFSYNFQLFLSVISIHCILSLENTILLTMPVAMNELWQLHKLWLVSFDSVRNILNVKFASHLNVISSSSRIFVVSLEIVILIVIILFANHARLKLHNTLQIIFRLQNVVKS